MSQVALHQRRWQLRWGRFTRSLWFLPTLFTLGALGLFLLTSWLDRRFHAQLEPTGWASWLQLAWFANGPGVAEALLTNIAGMWATIIGISFSVTLVTVQLTATKYIAQVLPLFERNRTNQVVLGSYLATVTYALLVARTVQLQGKGFVPYIGVNVATFLAVTSIFLLILFITNVVNFVRPQSFLEQTLIDIEKAMAHWGRPLAPWQPVATPAEAPDRRDERTQCIRVDRKITLTHVLVIELGHALEGLLASTGGPGGTWVIAYSRSPGEVLHRGEPLAYVTAPPGGEETARRVGRLVQAACDFRSHAEPLDTPEVGIEALAGLTIKGAVQGDLDVTFEGVDCLFSLVPQLAKSPRPSASMRLVAGAYEVVLRRPAPDLLAKAMRELTVISEVALAPSLPFRLVTEGISHRFLGAFTSLIDDSDWASAQRLLAHLNAWYQSAFFHVDWINGMHHLAADLADMALAAHQAGGTDAFAAVIQLMRDNRERLAPDAQAREALDGAFKRIEESVGATHPALAAWKQA